MFYNRDTGEVFESRAAAVQDAAEQYDFGDETNFVTYMGFPNEELPYIEIEDGQWARLAAAFAEPKHDKARPGESIHVMRKWR